MEFRTKVEIEHSKWQIQPSHRMLFVGSCFADNIGQMFYDNCFDVIVNPYGTMYNPVSICHTVSKLDNKKDFDVVFLTLGTNHVYRLKETGEIVDNCQKRPASLFNEEELSVEECANWLQKTVDILTEANMSVRIIITVSPIRYAKYGFHKSQLSKAILLLCAENIVKRNDNCEYYPAYEIVNDELRDYRFFNPDMIHPSQQAIEYIWEKLDESYFSDVTRSFIKEWQPIKAALAHKPFNPDSQEYKLFRQKAEEDKKEFLLRRNNYVV